MFTRMKKILLKESLSAKVSLANALIILLAFISVLFLLIVMDKKLSIIHEERMMNVYISNSLSSVDNKLKDMGRVSLICFSDEQIQTIMKEYDEYTYKEKLESENYLSTLFTSLIKMRNDITGVFMFNKKKLLFYQDQSSPSLKRDYDISKYIKENLDIEQDDSQVAGCRLIIGTLPAFMRYNKAHIEKVNYSNCVYMVRDISSFSPHEKIGYIMLIMPVEKMKNILEEYLEEETSYFLITKDGDVVNSRKASLIGGNLQQIYPELYNNLTSSEGSFWNQIEDENCMVTYQKSEYSGLYLITSKPKAIIQKDINQFARYSILVGAFFVLATVVLTIYLTNKRLKPLKKLSYEMAHFSPSNMEKRYEVKTCDETGILVNSFNHMMDIINDLIKIEFENKVKLQEAQMKQQKTSLLYLKNQINQHFLYNTLDTIRINAELNQDKDVSDMIMQLVNFFRLSVKVECQTVSIEHEVRLVKAYLKLIAYRYPKVCAEYDVDESLLHILIPNFMLQPLVENSVMHGLKNKGYKGTIILRVQRDPEDRKYINLSLYDSGMGLTDETYLRIEKMLMELNEDPWSKDEDNHIGIINVQQRLRMYYTSKCGLTYRQNAEGGVTAIIRIKEITDFTP